MLKFRVLTGLLKGYPAEKGTPKREPFTAPLQTCSSAATVQTFRLSNGWHASPALAKEAARHKTWQPLIK